MRSFLSCKFISSSSSTNVYFFYFALFVFDDTIFFCTCASFQILYVDSLLVENVDIPATTPRIAAWSRSLVDQVVKLDTNRDGSFGKLKVWIITLVHFFFFLSQKITHIPNLLLFFLF